ncbi:sorting nexin-20 isoform X2 [Molossus molossus]|uniref:Sorting nexin 20 n=2 Tax=Molossus molossus TaxID=27622 RepID=A0A7J8CB74_MOLMO|nr:sorting nexin-20 isoform X2 [Molossus molossus]XP_036131883.1 sorting nexin-20 isoform X2 [Molossus molossus]XP_036131884.1 sorting nexin-20 isoform X2 [Molossus molossus]KAF6408108.1 sorting nexin 20 [Molossus molossus]
MASAEHPGGPRRTGCRAQSTAGPQQEASATGPDLLPPGPEGDSDTGSSPNPNSSMTTRELQEYWRHEKGCWKPVKLLFEIASARIEERKVSKFVMYQIVVIQTGSFDSTKAVLERRYSDFQALQKTLLKTFGEEIEDVPFPKKHLVGNFTQEMILERKLAFKEYLSQLYAIRCVRRSREFIDFLTRPELKEAFGCLRAGQYPKALDILTHVVPLQEKLTGHCPGMVVPALCAMLVCHRELERPLEAFAAGERALERLQAREGHRYYAPLLDAMVRLAYALGKDFVSLQVRLEDSQLQKPTSRGFTLKELAVLEYL